jgi:hypothetical protein
MWGCCLLPFLLVGVVEAHEVAIGLAQGRPVVDGVFVNGHGPYRFVVDTGSALNEILPEVAREARIQATFRRELMTAIGSETVPGSNGLTVTVGEARVTGQEFLFAGREVLRELSRGTSGAIHGVLGQVFLANFDYQLDLRRKKLVFGKQELAGRRDEIRAVHGRMVVATSLGDLVLDSGAARLVLFGVKAVSGAETYMRTLAGGDAVGMVWSSLAIAGHRVWRGQAIALPQQSEAGVAGLMPVSLFRTVYVCNSGGYLVLE